MKNILLIFLLLTVTSFSFAQNNRKKHSCMKKEAVLRHMVIFKYKDTSTPEEIQKVTDAFLDLKTKIPQVKAIEWGTNVSPENLDQGFTHCYFLTFATEEDAKIYQVHAAHKAFQEVLKPHLDKVFVVDYWAK